MTEKQSATLTLPVQGDSIEKSAELYAKAGLTPLPIPAGEKGPRLPGWQNARFSALYDACVGSAKIGLRMGFQPSGLRLAAIDVDHLGALEKLEADLGPLPDTLGQQTAKGYHLIFTVPTDATLRNTTRVRGEKVDVRCDGGQIVAAPSVHESGAVYTWTDTRKPVPLPARWLEALTSPPKAEAPEWQPPARREAPSDRMRDSWTARFVREPSGSNALAGGLGSVLASWGWEDEEISGLMANWLGAADPRLPKHTGDALRAAASRRRGEPAPGVPKLQDLGVIVETAVPVFVASDDPLQVEMAMGGTWLNAEQICAQTLPPVAWISEQWAIAPGAPVLVAGYANAGKTMLVQDLLTAVATPGRRWLGEPVRHGRVIHIDHEQGMRESVARYQRLGLTKASRLQLCVFPEHWRLSMPGAIDGLRTLCEGAAILAIDSLRASSPDRDENESSIRQVLDPLTELSEETGCVVLLIHHARKGSAQDAGSLEVMRGSSALADAASSVITVTRSDGPYPQARLVKARTSGLLTRPFGDSVDLRLDAQGVHIDTSNLERIAREVADLPDGLSQRQLHDAVRGKKEVVVQAYRDAGKFFKGESGRRT